MSSRDLPAAPVKGPAPSGGHRTWRDRWRAWRDRRLLDPSFHRWASRSWLARAVARRESRALFDLVAGFTYSQVLFACVRLNLFKHLADQGPQDTSALAHWTALPEDGAQRLLAAASSLRLLERHDDGRWGLGPLGAPMVVHPAIAAMVEHHATLYHDLADPVALLRGERPVTAMSGYWPYADTDPAAAPARLGLERVAEYSQLMSVSQPLVSDQVLQSYALDKHQRLLDVGGGEGTFLRAVAAHAPHLQLMLFDLPAVADLARQRLAEQGWADRVEIHGGSFFSDPLPRGADLITLVRVLFDHPDDRVRQILRAVREALPEAGSLLVCEPMSGTPGAEAIGDAYYGMYLAAMGKGRSRSPAELTALLHSAGFSDVRLLPTPLPLQTRVLLARH